MIDFKEELAKYKPVLDTDEVDIVNPSAYIEEMKDISDLLQDIAKKINKE
jgi:hypothetical protein